MDTLASATVKNDLTSHWVYSQRKEFASKQNLEKTPFSNWANCAKNKHKATNVDPPI